MLTEKIQSTSSTSQLVEQSQAGCDRAFGELFLRYQPRLLRFLEKRLVGFNVDPDDVVQESMTKAWQNLHSFDQRFQFTTWLYTIATRTATDYCRRARRAEKLVLADSISEFATPTSEQPFDEEDADKIWRIARKTLSCDQFSALWLRYGEGLTIKEIANVLNRTAMSVRVQLYRSRNTLEPYLSEFRPQKDANRP